MNQWNKKSLDLNQYLWRIQGIKINLEEREFDKISKNYSNLSFEIKM